MTRHRLVTAVAWATQTFAPPVVLYALRFTFGRGWAFVGALACAVAVIVLSWWRHRRIARLTIISAVSAVALGGLGVIFESDELLQLEPVFHNAIGAVAIAASCVLDRPLLLEVARHRLEPSKLDDVRGFATRATWALAALFALRAVVYAILAARASLAATALARLVVGPVSFALFIGGLVVVRRSRATRV